jgi:hypothetical protein
MKVNIKKMLSALLLMAAILVLSAITSCKKIHYLPMKATC